ncbi:MAG: hypothetical protein U9R75_10555, partial [Candidatus Thermoplasmatota archaeon]|nr:hypothetical protein [Candidatus Thermoplasmatota archaeon]
MKYGKVKAWWDKATREEKLKVLLKSKYSPGVADVISRVPWETILRKRSFAKGISKVIEGECTSMGKDTLYKGNRSALMNAATHCIARLLSGKAL